MTTSTRRVCRICGIDCFWDRFDQQWAHMGWTVEKDEQPAPHRPVIALESLTEGEVR